MSSPDKSASVLFPPDAIPDEVFVSIVQVDEISVPPASGGFELLGSVYDFSAYDTEGNPMTEFGEMITITLRYDPADLNGLLEQDLKILYYDTLLAGWVPILSVVDAVSLTVTGNTDHFTWFGIGGEIPEPGTFVLFGLGLFWLLTLVRKRRNTRK